MMTIQHIGTRALSMYIGSEELGQLGLCPEAIGRREAQGLLEQALAEKSLGTWEAAEMEVYPGKDSVLLFVRRKASVPSHFLFTDFECLVSAAHLCPEPLPSSLARTDEGYLLTVYPFEGDRPPAVLYEYGAEQPISHYLPVHLAEQGAELLSASALHVLKTHFSDSDPA